MHLQLIDFSNLTDTQLALEIIHTKEQLQHAFNTKDEALQTELYDRLDNLNAELFIRVEDF